MPERLGEPKNGDDPDLLHVSVVCQPVFMCRSGWRPHRMRFAILKGVNALTACVT